MLLPRGTGEEREGVALWSLAGGPLGVQQVWICP